MKIEEILNSKKGKLILSGISILILFYVIVISVAPIRKLNELKRQVYADTVFYAQNSALLHYQQLFELNKTKALKEAELIIAQKDTFALVVNLNDSTVSLMLKGVKIHSAKIYQYKKDRFFNGINPLVYAKLFSKPMRTQSEFSSIVKEPIIIKKAPKDTIEAITNAYMPDTLIQNPAYLNLEIEHGFKLYLIQNEFNTPEEKAIERQMQQDIRKRKIADVFGNFIHWKHGSYTPNLVLYIRADELRSAYRAIPADVLVVLTY